jgi:predicted secreted hydrolase
MADEGGTMNGQCQPKRSRGIRARGALIALVVFATAICHLPSVTASPFKSATPGYEFNFPHDHGVHADFKTEWWYFTGNLRTESGRRYGFELTFFRVGVVPGNVPGATRWDLRAIAPAHFAITDVAKKEFRFHEKMNRVSPFTAGAAEGRLDVFNEAWRASTNSDGSWRLVAMQGRDSIDLTLRSRKAPAVHGENGISVKASGAGFASHYYSMTRLEVAGSINGERATGQAWMDHEFGSSVLRESQQGWDWFSIQLDNDTELMLYIIRRTDGTPDVTSSGSVVTSDGRVIHLRRDQVKVTPLATWRSPKSNAVYPVRWRLEVPTLDIALTIDPVMQAQELITTGSTQVTYWEGAVDVQGRSGGVPVRGEGYVEMTGYDRAFRAP